MKVEIEIDGHKCSAETDLQIPMGYHDATVLAAKSAVFARLCTEVRLVASKYIEAKYGKANGTNNETVPSDPAPPPDGDKV